MDEVLLKLRLNEILHITSKNTKYLFLRRSSDGGVVYSINNTSKKLSYITICRAFEDRANSIRITRKWYREFNKNEYDNNPCNYSVLISLLGRLA